MNSTLTNIHPHWHTNLNKINLPTDLEFQTPDTAAVIILEDVDLLRLINLLSCGNKELLLQNGLFKQNFQDHKTSKILEFWTKETKLLPPSIILSPTSDNNLMISGGRHRMNVALYYKQTSIPIIVLIHQVNQIQVLLNT